MRTCRKSVVLEARIEMNRAEADRPLYSLTNWRVSTVLAALKIMNALKGDGLQNFLTLFETSSAQLIMGLCDLYFMMQICNKQFLIFSLPSVTTVVRVMSKLFPQDSHFLI